MPLAGCWEHASLPSASTGQAVGGKAEDGDVLVPLPPVAWHLHCSFKEIPVPPFPPRHTQAGILEAEGTVKFLKQSRGAGQTEGHRRDEAEDGSAVG